MRLTIDKQWVDDSTAVIDGDVADQSHMARLGIYLDDGHRRAIVERELLGVEELRLIEPGCHAERYIVAETRLTGDVNKRHRLGVTVHLEIEAAAVFEHDRYHLLCNLLGGVRNRGRRARVRNRAEDAILVREITWSHLQFVGGNCCCLPHDLSRGLIHGRAAYRHRSRIVGASSERHDLCVAFHDFNVVDADTKYARGDLGEASHVALSGALGAAEYRHVTIGVHDDTSAFVPGSSEPDRTHSQRRSDAGALRERCKSNPEQVSFGAQLCLPAPQVGATCR